MMKNIIVSVAVFAFCCVFSFGQEKESSYFVCGNASFPVELSVPESWSEIVDPRDSYKKYDISKSYKLEFNGHMGEARFYFFRDAGVPEAGRHDAYRNLVAKIRDSAVCGGDKGGVPEFYDISDDSVAAEAGADAAYRTNILSKDSYGSLIRKYAELYFFAKYGKGVAAYFLLSDDPEFFGFSDETMSASNPECEYFSFRETPPLRFSETENQFGVQKVRFDDLKFFSVCEPKKLGRTLSGDEGYFAFCDTKGEAKLREIEAKEIMRKISMKVIGYDDFVPFTALKANDAKKSNADFAWTKSSEKCLSEYAGRKNARIDVLYKAGRGIIAHVSLSENVISSDGKKSRSSSGGDFFYFLSPSELAEAASVSGQKSSSAFSIVSDDGKHVVIDSGTDSLVRRFVVQKTDSSEEVLSGFYTDADSLLSGDEVRFIKLWDSSQASSDKRLKKFIEKNKIPADIKEWAGKGKRFAIAENFAYNLRTKKERSLGKYRYVKM